jgi:hypothetical protein
MQQNDYRPVGRPCINHIEHELAATELFHRLTVAFGHAAAGKLGHGRGHVYTARLAEHPSLG